MLHQKELVLNAKDTENMLSALDITRNIINTLSGMGSSFMRNIASGVTSLFNFNNDR
jgi:hypothetical protein